MAIAGMAQPSAILLSHESLRASYPASYACPAADPGLVNVANSLALSSAATFSVTLNGTNPASYSQAAAGGPIDLGNSTLRLVLGYAPAAGDSFTLLTTSGSSPIGGTFAGLAEGAVFTQGGHQFQITYQGGPNGNSVVLTCVA
jgi:hypothetical protein